MTETEIIAGLKLLDYLIEDAELNSYHRGRYHGALDLMADIVSEGRTNNKIIAYKDGRRQVIE